MRGWNIYLTFLIQNLNKKQTKVEWSKLDNSIYDTESYFPMQQM